MYLTFALTNRAVLLSGNSYNNETEIDFDIEDLPWDVRMGMSSRLYEDEYLCHGVVDENGDVVPSVWDGEPQLLLLHPIHGRQSGPTWFST